MITSKTKIRVEGVKAYSFEMPVVVVEAINSHCNGTTTERTIVRLGEWVDLEKLFKKK